MYSSFTSTTRDGNMSYRFGSTEEVNKNRAAFFARIGMHHEHVAVMEVEHGVHSARVSAADFVSPGCGVIAADALMTNDPKVALFLLTADCLPVMVYDARTASLALLHLGWRSIKEGLGKKVVLDMKREYGSDPQDIQVLIGPSIKQASYAHTVVSQNGSGWASYLTRDYDGKTHIDLPGYVVSEFEEMGIQRDHMDVSPIDTARDPAYFSHYRSTYTKEAEGRFATVCWL